MIKKDFLNNIVNTNLVFLKLYEFLYMDGPSTKPGPRWTLKSTSLVPKIILGDVSLMFDSRCD